MQVKPHSLVSTNDKEELEAQKQVNKKIDMEIAARARKLEMLRKINLIFLPMLAITFVLIFWIVGLRNAELL